MAKKVFEISIKGKRNGMPLMPRSLDVDEWVSMFVHARNLLFPEGRKGQSVNIDILGNGVQLKLIAEASAVVQAEALLSELGQNFQMSILHPRQADAIEHFQTMAEKHHFSYQIGRRTKTSRGFFIDRNTILEKSEELWLPIEMYVTGIIVNAGGKSNPNVHLDTKEFGTIVIGASHELLKRDEKNRLYKRQQIRVRILQNQQSGKYDKKSAELIEFVESGSNGETPDEYLDRLTQLAAVDWKG